MCLNICLTAIAGSKLITSTYRLSTSQIAYPISFLPLGLLTSPTAVLSLFRTNQASIGLLLFIYALVLQLPVLLGWSVLPEPPIAGGAATALVVSWLQDSFYLKLLLPVFLVTGQGIIANVLVTRHHLSRKITQFPGLFLMLCWSLVPAFRTFHPLQAANLFILLALLSLGRVYKKGEPAVAIFNMGAWLGIAFIFCPSYIVLFFAFAIGVGTMRQPDLRSILQLITGLSIPLFLVLSLTYVFGSLPNVLSVQFDHYGWWQWAAPTIPNQLGLGILGLLTIVVIGSFGSTIQLLNIEGKKNVGILYWLLFFLFLSVGISGNSGIPYLQALILPVGIVIGLRFIMISAGRAEFLHLLLFSAAIGTAIWSTF